MGTVLCGLLSFAVADTVLSVVTGEEIAFVSTLLLTTVATLTFLWAFR